MNSDDKGNPQTPEIKCNVNLKQKEGKVWQALVFISPVFVEALVLREWLRTLSWIHDLRLLAFSREVRHHFMPLTILHEVQDCCRVPSPARVLATPA